MLPYIHVSVFGPLHVSTVQSMDVMVWMRYQTTRLYPVGKILHFMASRVWIFRR